MILAFTFTFLDARFSPGSVQHPVFASGLMLSDTDFRIFDAYANLTGLDMALVGNSYVYHTRLDTPENLEVGAIQVSTFSILLQPTTYAKLC